MVLDGPSRGDGGWKGYLPLPAMMYETALSSISWNGKTPSSSPFKSLVSRVGTGRSGCCSTSRWYRCNDSVAYLVLLSCTSRVSLRPGTGTPNRASLARVGNVLRFAPTAAIFSRFRVYSFFCLRKHQQHVATRKKVSRHLVLRERKIITSPRSNMRKDSPKVSSPMTSVAMNSHHLKMSATPRAFISWSIR